jgi:predicted DNA-binding transcriptional regulator AlpA
MSHDLLKPEEFASLYHQSLATLATWRCRGKGPRFVKLGRRVLYRRADLDDWLEQSVRANTGDLR